MYEKKDYYYKAAKLGGYRSRSAYKLKQINKKFNLIKKGNTVIDIGAAPGGWTQVVLEFIGPTGAIVCADVAKIKPLEADNVVIIQGDVTENNTIEKIITKAGKAHCVISDIAPKTTGVHDLDRSRSAILSMQALEIAKKVLYPRGNFLTKVFQSEESEELFLEIKKTFSYSKRFRPPSTRKRSVEIYFIGKGYMY
ncbi:MAG: RlmE family RNA methyltransferase [Candidatus Methanofastidiosia archaeon]